MGPPNIGNEFDRCLDCLTGA